MKTVPEGINIDVLQNTENELIEQLQAVQKILKFLGVSPQSSAPQASANHAPKRKRKAKAKTWLDDIYEILLDAKEPLHWSKLYEGLQKRRPTLNAAQPAASVRSAVNRGIDLGDQRVIGAGNGKFALREWNLGPQNLPLEESEMT